MRFLLIFVTVLLAALSWAEPRVRIRYAFQDGPGTRETVDRLKADFERLNPNIEIVPEPVADEIFMRLLTQTAAGIAPDVAQLSVSLYQPFAMRGALVPLDAYAQRDLDLGRWYPNIVRYFTWDDRLWAIPRDVAPFGLVFYNRTLLREKGLSDPDPNWSWAYSERPELRERSFNWMIAQLTERDREGKTQRWGFAPAWPQLFFYLLLLSSGQTLWDDSAAPTQVTASDPEVVRLMEFATKTIVEDNTIPTWYQVDTVAQSSAYDLFVKGKVAMLLTFAGDIGRLRRDMEAAGYDWDVALFPAYEGKPLTLGTDGSGLAMFAQCRNRDEAWRWIQFVTGETGQRLAAKEGDQPAIRSLALEPGVWLPPTGKLEAPQNLKVTDRAALAMKYEQTPEYFEETRLYLDQAAFDILSGTKPPRETMERVDREGQIRLDAARRSLSMQPYPVVAAGIVGGFVLIGFGYWAFRGAFRRASPRQRAETISALKFLAPLVAGLFAFTAGPIVFSFLMSFAATDLIRPPTWRGAQNYVDAVTVDPVFLKSLEVTFTYALLSVPIGMAFALGLAILLNAPVRGVPLFRSMFYLPSLVSGVAASLIWMRVFNPETGILNAVLYGALSPLGQAISAATGSGGEPVNWLANDRTVLPAFVLMGLWGAGGSTVIFLAGLQGISPTYYEAATLDGAGPYRKFRNVTLPLISPAMFFSVVTGTIGAIQGFTQAFVMTSGGPNNATMFYMLNLYLQGFKSLKLGYASALAWILFLIILLLTALQFWGSRRWVHYEGAER